MLNEALRLIRVYHDMSKADVARELGMSRSFVTELEAGSKKVTIDTLEKYAAYFDMPVSSLMLFAERTDSADLTERTRVFVAGKALKMLDWVSTISRQEGDRKV